MPKCNETEVYFFKHTPLVLAIVSAPASAQYGDPFVDAMIASGERAQIKEQNERILRRQNEILEAQQRAQLQAQLQARSQRNYYSEYLSALSILDLIASGKCQYAKNVASFHPIRTQSAVRVLCGHTGARKSKK